MDAQGKKLLTKVVTRPRSDVTTIEADGENIAIVQVVTRPRSDVTTMF